MIVLFHETNMKLRYVNLLGGLIRIIESLTGFIVFTSNSVPKCFNFH